MRAVAHLLVKRAVGDLVEQLVIGDTDRSGTAPAFIILLVPAGRFRAYPLDCAAMRDGEHPPRHRAAGCVESGGSALYLDEDLLGDLLSLHTVRQHTDDSVHPEGAESVPAERLFFAAAERP